MSTTSMSSITSSTRESPFCVCPTKVRSGELLSPSLKTSRNAGEKDTRRSSKQHWLFLSTTCFRPSWDRKLWETCSLLVLFTLSLTLFRFSLGLLQHQSHSRQHCTSTSTNRWSQGCYDWKYRSRSRAWWAHRVVGRQDRQVEPKRSKVREIGKRLLHFLFNATKFLKVVDLPMNGIDEYVEANNVVPQMEKLLHHFHGDCCDCSHHHFSGMRSHVWQLQKVDMCLDDFREMERISSVHRFQWY